MLNVSQPPATASAIGVSAYVRIAKRRYDITGFDLVFTSVGVNALTIALATGTGVQLVDANGQYLIQRGDVIVLYLSVSSTSSYTAKGDYEYFHGVVDDVGPIGLTFGSFSVGVAASGTLTWLQNGSPQSSSIAGNSPFTLGPTVLYSTAKPPLAGTATILQPTAVKKNFGAELIRALRAIAIGGFTDSNATVRALRQIVPVALNERAAEVMARINTSLMVLHPEIDDTMIDIITADVNSYITGNPGTSFHSFLNLIQSLGGLLGFRLLEYPDGIWMVPYSPYFSSAPLGDGSLDFTRLGVINTQDTAPIVTLTAADYSNSGWGVTSRAAINGLILTPESGVVSNNGSSLFAGAFLRRAASPVGQVVLRTAPAFLASSEHLATDPTANPGSPTTRGRSVTQRVAEMMGDALAREYCLDEAFGPRTIRVVLPTIRTDISPLTAVRLITPKNVENALTSSLFGSVQTTTTSVNSAAGVATTTLEIGYIRSEYQQSVDVDTYQPITLQTTNGEYSVEAPVAYTREHPIWRTNVPRHRFDGSGSDWITDILDAWFGTG